jgi:signal transduction histidine kinase
VGLLSLRERAEELGGRCEVRCPEGGGTSVRAVLPYGAGVVQTEVLADVHPEVERSAR